LAVFLVNGLIGSFFLYIFQKKTFVDKWHSSINFYGHISFLSPKQITIIVKEYSDCCCCSFHMTCLITVPIIFIHGHLAIKRCKIFTCGNITQRVRTHRVCFVSVKLIGTFHELLYTGLHGWMDGRTEHGCLGGELAHCILSFAAWYSVC